jgi:2-iminobutanoate/2-iminopropanoate deaminase
VPKKEVIQVKLAADNPHLSAATRFGNLVFVAGQTGRHPVSGQVGKGVREQTNYALQRVKTILEAAGTSLDNVLTVTTYLTKREDLADYNDEYGQFFPTDKPARTSVEVMLNSPDLLVEITVIACVPE